MRSLRSAGGVRPSVAAKAVTFLLCVFVLGSRSAGLIGTKVGGDKRGSARTGPLASFGAPTVAVSHRKLVTSGSWCSFIILLVVLATYMHGCGLRRPPFRCCAGRVRPSGSKGTTSGTSTGRVSRTSESSSSKNVHGLF